MMGRLLRWLRVLGVDSLLREEGESLSALSDLGTLCGYVLDTILPRGG